MAKIDTSNPPAFPIPDFDKVSVAFGATRKDYLTREQLGDWYDMNQRTPFHEAVSGLFYKGGKLADYGLTFKPGVDPAKAMGAIRALLGSWDPPHEIKVGTVAVALANWCDYAKPETKAA
jgi:hypothetical protein